MSAHQRGELDHAFRRLEEENIDLARQVQNLQVTNQCAQRDLVTLVCYLLGAIGCR